ncbi:MAG TPA: arginine deiminase-related protein [Ktedonobacteraceae bacterium]|nr:arginine deiminase-related protein [Ktedonobacteraceae bacterium]
MSVSRQIQYSSQISDEYSSSQYRNFLMCPPDHFGVLYEINPWMKRAVQPDLDLARKQWNTLVSNLQEAGAAVEFIHPVASLPDMVFTADIGLVDRKRFIMSRFRYPQRQEEARHGAHWLQNRNYEVIELSLAARASLESSDIYPFRDYLLAGYGFRTTISAHRALANLSQRKVLPIQFVDARLYHLDLSFCPLDDRRAIIAPCAWSRRSCKLIEKLVPEALVLESEEALTFCANSVVVGKTIIMPSCPLRVGRILERWGFTICISPVSEFLKAGGAIHCLVLALHGSFSPLADSIQ